MNIRTKIWNFLPLHKGQIRSWLVATGVIVGLLNLSSINLYMTVLGIASLVFGTYLQVICRGHIHQNEVLTTSGPFRWVRHPMHLSKLSIDLGFCFIINYWPLTLIYLVLWNYAHWKNRVKEENELIEIFGDRYREYREKVPSLIPWKGPLPEEETSETHFDWTCENLTTGRYLGRAMRYASYPYLFFFAMELGTFGTDVFTRSDIAIYSLSAFVLLYIFYKMLYSTVKHREFPLPRWTFKTGSRILFFLLMIVMLVLLPENEPSLLLEGTVPEATARWGLIGVGLLLVLPLLFSWVSSVYDSHRFWYLMEAGTIVALCFTEGYPWLATIPLLYYFPLFIYQTAEDMAIQFDHVFSPTIRERVGVWHLQHTALLLIGALFVSPGEVHLAGFLTAGLMEPYQHACSSYLTSLRCCLNELHSLLPRFTCRV